MRNKRVWTKEQLQRRDDTRRKNGYFKDPVKARLNISNALKNSERFQNIIKRFKEDGHYVMMSNIGHDNAKKRGMKCTTIEKQRKYIDYMKYDNPMSKPENKIKLKKNKTKEHKEHTSNSITRYFLTGNFKFKGYFFSNKNNKNIGYRSSYELLAFQMLEKDPSVLKYDYESLSIQYTDKNGQIRNTIPDLFVHLTDNTKQIIEVKPQFKIDKNLDNTREKLEAMLEFAKHNNYKFSILTEKELHI